MKASLNVPVTTSKVGRRRVARGRCAPRQRPNLRRSRDPRSSSANLRDCSVGIDADHFDSTTLAGLADCRMRGAADDDLAVRSSFLYGLVSNLRRSTCRLAESGAIPGQRDSHSAVDVK